MPPDLRNITAATPARSRKRAETFFRYLPVSEGLREWGMYVASKVSYTWFRRVLKEYTGFSPRQFQWHHRIQRASQLLAGTALPVGEIAEQLGFQTVYYFSELSKRRRACSPLAYRHQRVSSWEIPQSVASPSHRGDRSPR